MLGLAHSIAGDEIYAALYKINGRAVVHDDVGKPDPRVLLVYFNLWLYAGFQPVNIRHSLIPKVANPSVPAPFTPIAMSPCSSRVFHVLLAGLTADLIEVNSRQRAA